jgi:hypothetical protein
MQVKCKCEYCHKEIVVEVPEVDYYNNDFDCKLGNSCSSCIPEDSAARDGINESIYKEVKQPKECPYGCKDGDECVDCDCEIECCG